MRIITLLTFWIFSISIVIGQCDDPRYQTFVFDSVSVQTDITYGGNTNVLGEFQSLEMDVYQPFGDDEEQRALIFFAHGGSFVVGDKSDLEEVAKQYARLGYVVASIEYRLGFTESIFTDLPDSVDATAAVIRGVHDMKAAMRWFIKDATIESNQFKIDIDKIFIAGFSAGGFIVNQLAYLDEESEWPVFGSEYPGLEGGIPGNSGNPGFEENFVAGLNVAGAIGDTSWIKTDDEPLISFHGTADDVVPFGHDVLTVDLVFLQVEIGYVYGSSTIHQRLENLGNLNCFTAYEGQGHVPESSNPFYADTTFTKTRNFFASFLCNQDINCNYEELVTTVNAYDISENVYRVYPNPFSDQLSVASNNTEPVSLKIYDLSGRLHLQMNNFIADNPLLLGDLEKGVYLIKIGSKQGQTQTIKVIKH